MLDQVWPSVEVWISYAVAKAESHCSTTELMVAVASRSTCSHCGSEKELDQRVCALPSTAPGADKSGASQEEAIAGWPWDSRVMPSTVGAADGDWAGTGANDRELDGVGDGTLEGTSPGPGCACCVGRAPCACGTTSGGTATVTTPIA